ncbi:hypothetical protein AJ87_20950 [Rhizobium yanglingense]|nr:hypothetical protein AJ87_20950 [Rhizobium yanglingense]
MKTEQIIGFCGTSLQNLAACQSSIGARRQLQISDKSLSLAESGDRMSLADVLASQLWRHRMAANMLKEYGKPRLFGRTGFAFLTELMIRSSYGLRNCQWLSRHVQRYWS